MAPLIELFNVTRNFGAVTALYEQWTGVTVRGTAAKSGAATAG